MTRHFEDPTQFRHWMRVLVRSQREVRKFLRLIHKHRRRLPASLVASGRLATFEHGHEALRKREAGGTREGFRHCLNRTLADQQVSLNREVRSGNMPEPVRALAAAPGGAASCCVHDSELPNVFAGVSVDERIKRLLGRSGASRVCAFADHPA